jgi:hypothetical protein
MKVIWNGKVHNVFNADHNPKRHVHTKLNIGHLRHPATAKIELGTMEE